jgi:hypothetical protein
MKRREAFSILAVTPAVAAFGWPDDTRERFAEELADPNATAVWIRGTHGVFESPKIGALVAIALGEGDLISTAHISLKSWRDHGAMVERWVHQFFERSERAFAVYPNELTDDDIS